MTRSDTTYLHILKNVCTDTDAPLTITSEDLPQLAALATRHFTSPFLLPYISDKATLSVLKQQTKGMILQYYQLEQFTRKVAQILDEAQISYYLLKGISLSAVYPQPESRKLGDVDLYISDSDAFQKACGILREHGFCPMEENSDHHVTFSYTFPKIGKTFELELHYRIVGMYQYEPANQLVDQIFTASGLSPVRQKLGSYSYPVLPPTETVFYLIHHMLKHYLYSGFGIRLLCDFVFYLKQYAKDVDFALIHNWCRQSRIFHLYEIILESCRIYLGLPDSVDSDVHADATSCTAFMRKILADADMGSNTSSALVGSTSYEKVTWRTYLQEGHFQMKLQYPRLGKCILFWPVLWGITFFRFVKNTYQVRNTTVRQTLHQFRKKNKKTKLIRIFENSDC